MKSNIILFCGEEKYLLYQDLKKRKDAFGQKYGKENIFEFKSDNINVGEIINAIFSGGLFVSKKLVIVHGVIKDTDVDNKVNESKLKEFEERFMNNFSHVSDDTVLVFVSFSPDKRLKLFKFASENFTIKEYKKLKPVDLKVYIKNKLGDMIDTSSIDYLIEVVGDELFALNNEMDKLQMYCQKNNIKISKKVIDDVVYQNTLVNAFEVLDYMLFDKTKTLDYIKNLQEKGADTFQFLGMLYWGIKASLQIIDLYGRGINDSKVLASELGLHPFVVLKNIKIIDKLSSKKDKLKEMFQKLISLDMDIKTGRLPQEIFWLEIKKIIL